jgi:acyl carrier protein
MQIQDFIAKFEAEINDIAPGTIKPDTVFKQLDAWNSMQALIFIAMVDSEYGVTLTAENLHTCATVDDLFSLIQQKLKSKKESPTSSF